MNHISNVLGMKQPSFIVVKLHFQENRRDLQMNGEY